MMASAKEKVLEREKVRMAYLLGRGCRNGPMPWRDRARNARASHAVDAAGLMPNAAGSFSRGERLAFASRDILDVTSDSAMGV
jgi:hypothetical protein